MQINIDKLTNNNEKDTESKAIKKVWDLIIFIKISFYIF